MEKSLEVQADQATVLEQLKETLDSKLWWVIWALLVIIAAQLGVDLGVIPGMG